MTIYIAGKISGLEIKDYLLKFMKAETFLQSRGFKNIINPVRAVDKDTDWQTAMRICIAEIVTKCDAIFLLPDWEESEGAKLELLIAQKLGLKIFSYDKIPKIIT